MPLQTQNFLGMPIQRNDTSGISDGLSNYLKGYEGGMAPERLQEEAKKRKLENALKEVEAKYAEPNAQQNLAMGEQNLQSKKLANAIAEQFGVSEKEAEIALKQAQASHYKDQAAGRTFAPSALGKLIQERNDLAEQDPNSPLLAEYDRVIKATGGNKFAPSGLGKLYTELQQVEDGFLPGSNGTIPLNAAEQDDLRKKYKLQIQKNTTDQPTRTSSLQGTNLLKSINASDIDALTKYSGPMGAAQLKSDQAKDLAGKPTEKYLKYLEALQAVQLEAKELRQFFGDSITPEAANAIYEMVNATSLTRSPEAAKRMIQKSRDTIKKQVKTFQDALKSIEPYENSSAQGSGNLFGSLQLEDDGSL